MTYLPIAIMFVAGVATGTLTGRGVIHHNPTEVWAGGALFLIVLVGYAVWSYNHD